jgi:tryptophan 7-halogenase
MESDRRIRRIAIVGGSTAAWLSAVLLARKLGTQCSIHLVETPEAAIMGQGEGTLPPFLEFLRFVGIDQNDFIDKTQATYSLGTKYFDWRGAGHSFWRPYGTFGPVVERRPFFHFWHKARAQGLNPRLEYFSLEVGMGEAGRFIFPTNQLGVARELRYGLHCDSTLLSRYFRSIAERLGIARTERRIAGVTRREDGSISELRFEEGEPLVADLFLDCTSEGVLIERELGVPFIDYSKQLPCDRVLVAPTAIDAPRTPFVSVGAKNAGWQWRLPLQHLVANGYCYSSAHLSEEEARTELLASIGSEPLAEVRAAPLRNGRRAESWKANVIAIGPAAGAVEAVATTNTHLVINGLLNLLDRFPDRSFDTANTRLFNDFVAREYDAIRDYALALYALSAREGAFWDEARARELPADLAVRIDNYRGTGRVAQRGFESFSELDWFFLFDGQGVVPRDYDPLVDVVDFEQVKRLMLACHQKVMSDAQASPTHDSFFAAANARLGGTPGRPRAAGASGPTG